MSNICRTQQNLNIVYFRVIILFCPSYVKMQKTEQGEKCVYK